MRWAASYGYAALFLLLLCTTAYADYELNQTMRGLQFASQSWSDLDNDGDLDLITCGQTGTLMTDVGTAETRIYLNEITGNTSSLTLANHSIMNLTHCSVSAADLDNDGDKDIVISGTNSTADENLLIYIKQGTGYIHSQSLPAMTFSTTTLGDIDQDGDLDLVALGCADLHDTGAAFNCNDRRAAAYLNSMGTMTGSLQWFQNLPACWMASAALGDYDNDGDLDLAVSGFTDETRSGPITEVYINNGSTFSLDTYNSITGTGWGSVVWGDYDNDTDLDLFVAGADDLGLPRTIVYANDAALNTVNTRPDPPQILSSEYNQTLQLTWNHGTDLESSRLYYNLRAGPALQSNQIVTGVFAGSSNPAQGYFGNMQQALGINLSIPDRCVYWQVQSIDAGLMRSSWSIQQVHSSTEVCDSFDNDCDTFHNSTYYNTSIDEGFDRDGDGFLPWNFEIGSQTYNCTGYTEYDCDDSSPSSYPGAGCTRDGYVDTRLVWDNERHACRCEGTEDRQQESYRPGGSVGNTNTQTNECTSDWECSDWSECSPAGTRTRTCTDTNCNQTRKETENCTYQQETQPEAQEGEEDDTHSLGKTIVRYNQLMFQSTVELVERRTRFRVKVSNMGLFSEYDVNLTVFLPKDVINTTEGIQSSHEFLILREDPEIRYRLGELSPGQSLVRTFSVPGELSHQQADSVIITITKYNKTEDELEEEEIALEEQKNATDEVLDVTLSHEVDYENNITTFNIDFNLKENVTRLQNVSIIMEIPKCMIEIIKDEDFLESFEFEIQNPDPQIIWHMGEIITEDSLRLSIRKIADEDCLNKAKVLAVARDIMFLEHEIDEQNVLITAIITVLIFLVVMFASTYTHVIRHSKNHIFQLIRRILKLHKLGWTDDKIKEKLKGEKIPNSEIEEAFSLNARNKLHYWFIKFGVNLGAFVIFTILIASFVDVLEILPADADFIKKVVSWVLIFIVFYHVSVTRVLFGFKKHADRFYKKIINLDFGILLAFMLMLSKDLFVFAKSSAESEAFTYDFLNLISRAQPVWEPRLFYAGLILLIPISAMIAFRKEIYHSSLSAILGISGKAKSIFSTLSRTVVNLFLLLFFYFVLFDKMMEWLAISIDSHIITVLFIASVIFYIRRRLKTRKYRKMGGIEEQTVQVFGHIDDFYDHLVDLFHYRKTLVLGILGILILNMLVGVSVYLIPYIIAHEDPLYSAYVGQDNHQPLFLGDSIYSSALEAIPYSIQYDASVISVLALNLIAIISVMVFVSYFWYWCVKHRHNTYFALDRFFSSRIRYIIPFSVAGLVAFFMNPVFSFRPFYFLGQLGVDILSNTPDPGMIHMTVLASLLAFAVSWLLLIVLRRTTVRLFTFVAYTLMMAYIALFAYSYISYLMSEWVSAVHFILIAVYGFLLYIFGAAVSFIYVLMIIFRIPFLRRLFHVDMVTIHHSEKHRDIIHGYKTDRLADLIIRNMARGHEPFIIIEYLLNKGYSEKEIEEARKKAEDDPRFEEAERHIIHRTHSKKSLAELHRWIRSETRSGKDFDAILKSCLQKGFYEDDVIIALKHVSLDKRYKELEKYDYIAGVDEERPSDEEQYEEEEAYEIADYYIAKGLSEDKVKKLLKDAKFQDRTIYDILQIIRLKSETKKD